MATYEQMLSVLTAEWARLATVVEGLTDADFARSTALVPLEPDASPWTIAELVAHLSFGANMVSTLIEGSGEGEPDLNQVSFFTLPREQVAPLVYQLSLDLTQGRGPAEIRGELLETFDRIAGELIAADPDQVGPAAFARMTLREFVPTRIVEAVVHGVDLTAALDRPPVSTDAGNAVTSDILDGLLARRGSRTRPAGLADDADWVRAGSGRTAHPDQDLPLIN